MGSWPGAPVPPGAGGAVGGLAGGGRRDAHAGGLTPRGVVLQFGPVRCYLGAMDTAPAFALTERAAARIAEIAGAQAAPGGEAPALRVAVLAGGCSGFQYRFDLETAAQADDLVIARGGARVVVDPASLDLLAGSELDYTDELMGSHFAVRNPQAKSACGCGTSFSVE